MNIENDSNEEIFHFFYHLARLITNIDETKFKEKIIVDQKHDFTARRFDVNSLVEDEEEFIMEPVDEDKSDNFSVEDDDEEELDE